MKKFIASLTIFTVAATSMVSNALDVKIGQVVKITSAEQFKSPFAESTYLEVVGMKLITSDPVQEVVEFVFRPYLNAMDRQRIANVPSDIANQTFTYNVVNLRTISEIPGIELMGEVRNATTTDSDSDMRSSNPPFLVRKRLGGGARGGGAEILVP